MQMGSARPRLFRLPHVYKHTNVGHLSELYGVYFEFQNVRENRPKQYSNNVLKVLTMYEL